MRGAASEPRPAILPRLPNIPRRLPDTRIPQRSLGLITVRRITRQIPRVARHAIANGNRRPAARRPHGKVAEADIVAHGVGARRARQLGDGTAAVPVRRARKVLKQDVGDGHAGRVCLARLGVDLAPVRWVGGASRRIPRPGAGDWRDLHSSSRSRGMRPIRCWRSRSCWPVSPGRVLG